MSGTLEKRRRAVVRVLMARGLDQNEIFATLKQPKYADVDSPHFCGDSQTGEHASKLTIRSDWDHALEHWQDVKETEKNIEQKLAELRELKRC